MTLPAPLPRAPRPPTLWRGDGPQIGLARRRAPAAARSAALEEAHLRVHGVGGTGVSAAEAAARAGVAVLTLVDGRREDPGPGTLPALTGGNRAARAARLLAGLRPDLRIGLDTTRRCDVEIVTAYGAVPPPLHHRLMLDGTPHVAALVDEAGISLVPVLPGSTPCLRCRDLTLADADPAWPVLARQCEGLPPFEDPLDAAVAGALAVASLAALLSGGGAPAWRIEGGAPRIAPALPHPQCGCGAA